MKKEGKVEENGEGVLYSIYPWIKKFSTILHSQLNYHVLSDTPFKFKFLILRRFAPAFLQIILAFNFCSESRTFLIILECWRISLLEVTHF